MQARRALLVLCSWALLPVVQSKQCTRADVVGGGQSWTFDLTGCATLNLYRSSIGAEGARALAEALKTNGALTTLYLNSNSIGDEGARALAEALEANGALTALLLDGNSIGDKAQAAVYATLAVPPEERPGRYEKAVGDRAAAERAVVQKAKTLGLHAVFEEMGIASGPLARAVQWCTQKGADTAADLAHLKRGEVDQLVESLGLTIPILKQRQLAAKLAAAFKLVKDEV